VPSGDISNHTVDGGAVRGQVVTEACRRDAAPQLAGRLSNVHGSMHAANARWPSGKRMIAATVPQINCWLSQ